ALGAVIGRTKIDRVFVDAFEQRLGNIGKAAFGVAHRRGVIAVNIAEIALPFDQRIANGEVLPETHECVVHRLLALRMRLADNGPEEAGALLEPGWRVQSELAHGMEQSAMNRL